MKAFLRACAALRGHGKEGGQHGADDPAATTPQPSAVYIDVPHSPGILFSANASDCAGGDYARSNSTAWSSNFPSTLGGSFHPDSPNAQLYDRKTAHLSVTAVLPPSSGAPVHALVGHGGAARRRSDCPCETQKAPQVPRFASTCSSAQPTSSAPPSSDLAPFPLPATCAQPAAFAASATRSTAERVDNARVSKLMQQDGLSSVAAAPLGLPGAACAARHHDTCVAPTSSLQGSRLQSSGHAMGPSPAPIPQAPVLSGCELRASTSPRQQQQHEVPFRPHPGADTTWLPNAGPFTPLCVPDPGLLFLSHHAPISMHHQGRWSAGEYEVQKKLHAGYASRVYKAACLHSGADVVLKAYKLAGLSSFLRHQVLRELDIHSRLDHPGVVRLLAAFREGDTLVLVLEYVRGGSLDRVRRKLGGRMTEFQAMHLVLLPLLGTLAYLHGQGVVHRDIKPENCLLTEDWELKVCDFGVSICLADERAVTRAGSREYMAPEVYTCPLKRSPEDNKSNAAMCYTPAADVWSLGATLYELLVGFTPFPGGPPTPAAVRAAAASRPEPARALPFPSTVSAEGRDFITTCLALHPGDRPTARQLLAHPWVQAALAGDGVEKAAGRQA